MGSGGNLGFFLHSAALCGSLQGPDSGWEASEHRHTKCCDFSADYFGRELVVAIIALSQESGDLASYPPLTGKFWPTCLTA